MLQPDTEHAGTLVTSMTSLSALGSSPRGLWTCSPSPPLPQVPRARANPHPDSGFYLFTSSAPCWPKPPLFFTCKNLMLGLRLFFFFSSQFNVNTEKLLSPKSDNVKSLLRKLQCSPFIQSKSQTLKWSTKSYVSDLGP